MKQISFKAVELREALKALKPFYNKKASMPILTNVRVKSNAIYAQDADAEARYAITPDGCGGDSDFDLCISYPDICDEAKEREGVITIKYDETLCEGVRESVSVPVTFSSVGDCDSTAMATSSHQWPIVIENKEYNDRVSTLFIQMPDLKNFDKAVADDPLRPTVNGMFIDVHRGTVVASNGRIILARPISSLSLHDNKAELKKLGLSGGYFVDVNLHKRYVPIMSGKSVTIAEVYKKDKLCNRVRIGIGNLYIDTRVIEGKYPHYYSVVPMQCETGYISVEPKMFRTALKKVSTAMNASHAIGLYSDCGTLHVAAKDVDNKKEKMADVKMLAEMSNYNVGFKYDLLNLIPADWTGTIWSCDASRGATFELEDGGICLIMPLMIDNVDKPQALASKHFECTGQTYVKKSSKVCIHGAHLPEPQPEPEKPAKANANDNDNDNDTASPTITPAKPAEPANPKEQPKPAPIVDKRAKENTERLKEWEKMKKVQGEEIVLLYRMGDFYELYNGDAQIAADTLGITLTTAKCLDGTMSMAGFPHHALDNYLPRLIRAGYRVAICDENDIKIKSNDDDNEEPTATVPAFEGIDPTDEEIAESGIDSININELGNEGDVIVDNEHPKTEDTPAAPIVEEEIEPETLDEEEQPGNVITFSDDEPMFALDYNPFE